MILTTRRPRKRQFPTMRNLKTIEATLCPSQPPRDNLTPAYLEGWRDGRNSRESSPNMQRGHDYARGWITARYCPHLRLADVLIPDRP
jgi:hypothetical protein